MPSAKLIPAIWAAAREHKVSREELYEAVFAGFKKNSVKDLSDPEAYQLLDGLRGAGKSGVRGPRRWAMGNHGRRKCQDKVTYLVADRELQLLSDIAAALNWNPERLRLFCERQIGADAPQTMEQFNKVMWPLKAIQRRMEGASDATHSQR